MIEFRTSSRLHAPETGRSLHGSSKAIAALHSPTLLRESVTKWWQTRRYAYHTRRRTLTIRHVSDHRIVALLGDHFARETRTGRSCVEDFVAEG